MAQDLSGQFTGSAYTSILYHGDWVIQSHQFLKIHQTIVLKSEHVTACKLYLNRNKGKMKTMQI